MVETKGNKNCHLILRGGHEPNYDPKSIAEACEKLTKANLPPQVMVDFSHANSRKRYEKQQEVCLDISQQIMDGNLDICGVMIESHLKSGAQNFTPGKDDPAQLEYGKSITDACLGFEDSMILLEELSSAVKTRKP